MPIAANRTDLGSGQQKYPDSPFVGQHGPMHAQKVDLAALVGTDLIDADGIIKPGAAFAAPEGVLVPVGAGNVLFGVLPYAVKVAAGSTAGDLDGEVDIVVATSFGLINTGIVKSSLGRDYNADELAAFAGTGFTLTGGKDDDGAGVLNDA